MNNAFWGLLKKNTLEMVREKRRNMGMFLLPILLFAFIYLFFSSSQVEGNFVEPMNIGIIDNDSSMYSKMLINNYKDNEAFSEFVTIHTGESKMIYENFQAGELDAVLDIPQNFADSLMYFEHMPIQVSISYKNPIKAVLLKNVLKSYEDFITSVEVGVVVLYDTLKDLGFSQEEITFYNNAISYDLIFTAIGRNQFFDFKELIHVPSTSSMTYFFTAIIMMFLLYISLFIAIDLIRENENRSLNRLKLTNISMFQYLLSKLLAASIYIFIYVILWYGLIEMIYGSIYHSIMNLLFVYTCILVSVSLAMLLSSLFKSEENMILFGNVFIFINAVIGGSIIPIHFMPKVIQSLAQWTPNYWMIRGLLYIETGYQIIHGYKIMGIFVLLSIALLLLSHKRYSKVVK